MNSSTAVDSPRLNRILGAAALVITLIVYYLTTCPVIYFGDAGELITAAWRGGIAHPPGYPAYIIILAIFLRLPLSWMAPHTQFVQPVAWQANFFSAVLGAMTIWIVYLIILRITKYPWIAFAGAILISAGRTLWSQSGIAEAYALNALLFSLMILLAIIQNEKPRGSFGRLISFRWGSLVWGLALSNHHESIFLFPLWLAMLYLALQPGPETRRPALPHARTIVEGIFFIAFGLLPYLYLPIAASFKPVLNWGNPSTLENFINVLTRAEYRAVKGNITGDLVTSLDIFLTFLYWSVIQYTPVLLLLAIPGFAALNRRSPHFIALSAATISILLMSVVFIIYFAGIDASSMFFLEVYFIPWYILLGILVSAGLPALLRMIKNVPAEKSRIFITTSVIIIIAGAVSSYARNRDFSDMSDNIAGYVYSHDVLATLSDRPAKNILITGGDEIFLFWYWKWVEGVDKNVAVLGTDALGSCASWFWDDLRRDQPDLILPCDLNLNLRYTGSDLRVAMMETLLRNNDSTHNVWMTAWDREFDPVIHEGPWHMVLDGPILELERDYEGQTSDYPRASVSATDYYFTSLLDINRRGLAPFEVDVYDRYAAACYNLATYFDWNSQPEQAVEFASLCLRFRPGYSPGSTSPSPVSILVSNIYETGDIELARQVISDLLVQDPGNSLYHSAMAEVHVSDGNYEKALEELELAMGLDPENEFIKAMYEDLKRQLTAPIDQRMPPDDQ